MSAKIKVPKKKSKTKQKHLKAVHQKVKLFRANEPLLSVFMWGVNHTVAELSHVPPPIMLMPDDFKAFSKTKVDNHCFNKENLPSHFKIKEYCPNVFRNLRDRFGVDEHEYMRSLTRHEPTPTDSPGRSHANFYLSYDKKFVVKTLSAEEVAEVHSVMRPYHEYVVEKHGMTLLPQYLGMYRLTVEGGETYLIVMRNIFGRRYPIHMKYDLKGSTVQRQASEKERAKDLPTYKDNDFLEGNHKLFLNDEAKEKLLSMLNSDVEFLAKLHLMDYSLLVGIHDISIAHQEAASVPRNRPVSTSGTDGGSADDEDDGDDQGSYIGGGAVARVGSATGNKPGVGILGRSPPGAGDSSGPDNVSLGGSDAYSQPTPPDSPPPSTGAFGNITTGSELDLTDEFYAIPSREDAPNGELYFIGLIDILTYYGVKKRTASAAKTVKYGSEAEISTVKPDQYAKRLVEFVNKALA